MKIHLSQPCSFHQLGQRKNQEDARFPDMDRPSMDRAPFFVVCDGVGGQDKGERASRTVCDAFGEQMKGFDLAQGFGEKDFSTVFSKVYDVFSRVASSECETMATTLTFVCFHKNGYMAAHCGDSRIYHIRPGQGIVYKSEDHSLVQQMVRNGIIRPEEAESHPQSNIITRCIMLPQGEDDLPKATDQSRAELRLDRAQGPGSQAGSLLLLHRPHLDNIFTRLCPPKPEMTLQRADSLPDMGGPFPGSA